MSIMSMNHILTASVGGAIPLALCACMSVGEADHAAQGTLEVLIVDGFSNHNWEQTTQLTRRILEASDLFSVDVSTAPPTAQSSSWDTWRPRFSDYSVVIQNCNSLGGRPTWPIEVQQDLEAHVSNGGGLYILHSGNNSFSQWKEYNRMIGLGWRDKDFGWAITVDATGRVSRVPPGQGGNTSHGKRIDAVLTRVGDHPIHEDLPRQWRAADLEVYSYARGPAENLTVLSYAREPKTELNFPIEWVVQYGQGRVYNSTFGHVWEGDVDPPGMRCIAFQTLLIRAVEWLGRQEVTWSIPNTFPDANTIQLRGPPHE